MKINLFCDVDRIVSKKITDVSEVLTASIIRAIAVTSVNFYDTTKCNIQKHSHLHSLQCPQESDVELYIEPAESNSVFRAQISSI
jgi:hypothetical protein